MSIIVMSVRRLIEELSSDLREKEEIKMLKLYLNHDLHNTQDTSIRIILCIISFVGNT